MQLKPLYQVRFHYPEAWDAELTGPGGTEEFNFLFAEGHCTGRLSGRFRGANHPRRRTDHTYGMDLQGLIETEDGAEVRAPSKPPEQMVQGDVELVCDVSELVWEAPAT